MIIDGKVWKYGDGVGATDIVPSRHDKAGMTRDWPECARHLLEDVDPSFADSVQPGDILVAGKQLGSGHAHYYMAAIMGSHAAGVSALLAESVSALFFRAAIDAGVTAWSLPGITDLVATGDHLRLDLRTGEAENRTTGASAQFAPVSPIVLDILDAGGADSWALQRVGADREGDVETAAPAVPAADQETDQNVEVGS